MQKNGFTLMELLIVVALAIMLMITAVSLFFTTIVGTGKTASAEYVKQSGDQALTQMTYLIRNARKLVPNGSGQTCESNMRSLGVLGYDNGVTQLMMQVDNGVSRIASGSGQFLTPPDIVLEEPLTFDCSPTDYDTPTWDGSPPIIVVRFTLRKGDPAGSLARDIVTIPFESTVTLRN